MAKDPVCGMDVDEKQAAAKTEYNGQTYYFCSAYCKAQFEKEPGKYVKRECQFCSTKRSAVLVSHEIRNSVDLSGS
jgi:YHS domain-containing protein